MKSRSLEEYIRNNSEKPDSGDGYQFLTDKLQDLVTERILYSRSVGEHKDNVLHLFLWDMYYYGNTTFDNNQKEVFLSWYRDNKESIIKCLDEGDEDLTKLIHNIIKHWPFLRDELFNEDFQELEECNTVEDFEHFISKHPQSYPEYLLKAKYRIAVLTHTIFEEFQQALEEYPDSDWVKELEKRCGKIEPIGLKYLLSESIEKDVKLKDSIMKDFLEKFVMVPHVKSGSDNTGSMYVSVSVVTEKLWNIVLKKSCVFEKGDDIPKLMTYDELKCFIDGVQQLVSIKFRLLTIQEWEKCAYAGEKGHLFSGGNEIKNVAVYSGNSGFSLQPVKSKKSNKLGIYDMSGNAWEWCQSESEELSVAPIKGGDFTSPEEWCEISATKYVPKSCYAGCRLVLDC
jgi:hypothetical protein